MLRHSKQKRSKPLTASTGKGVKDRQPEVSEWLEKAQQGHTHILPETIFEQRLLLPVIR